MDSEKMKLIIITVLVAFVAGAIASFLLPDNTSSGVYVAIGIACAAVINVIMRRNTKK